MKTISNLQGHHKKVTLVKFNPTAANVLASTAADASVKIWDIERCEELSSYEPAPAKPKPALKPAPAAPKPV